MQNMIVERRGAADNVRLTGASATGMSAKQRRKYNIGIFKKTAPAATLQRCLFLFHIFLFLLLLFITPYAFL
jgi:hypothetical protein